MSKQNSYVWELSYKHGVGYDVGERLVDSSSYSQQEASFLFQAMCGEIYNALIGDSGKATDVARIMGSCQTCSLQSSSYEALRKSSKFRVTPLATLASPALGGSGDTWQWSFGGDLCFLLFHFLTSLWQPQGQESAVAHVIPDSALCLPGLGTAEFKSEFLPVLMGHAFNPSI